MLSKKQIGKLIPYPAIEAGCNVNHAGPARCRVCRAHVRHFQDSGYGYEVLERLKVVSGLKRFADRCPICHSTARERRIEEVGQDDHLRRFTPSDHADRIAASALILKHFNTFAWDGKRTTDWILDPFEVKHICYKSREI